MDNFIEWLSDNLRYILLGLAIILVLVIAIFVVRLVGGSGSSKKENAKETVATEMSTETEESESETAAGTGVALVEDDASILAAVQNYYTAMSNKDMDTLTNLVESFGDSDKDKINNSIIESYNNIKVYSKTGLTEGSYVVYPYYEAKVQDVEDLVPSLGCLYLKTKEDGSLYVADTSSDKDAQAYIEKTKADADVKTLIEDVTTKYNALLESNDTLKSMLDELSTPETEVTLPDSSDVDVSVNKVVQATDDVNVRSDSSETADILGMLTTGEQVTKVQSLDNGWTEIKYGSGTGFVKSEYLSE